MVHTPQPIGIILPVARGLSGYFDQSFDVLTQVKSNIGMLLKTRKGERRMNPNFGSGLWELLFEGNTDSLAPMVESTVRRDVEKWLPYVNINQVTVKHDTEEIDKYAVGISIIFTVSSAGITQPQTMDIILQQGTL